MRTILGGCSVIDRSTIAQRRSSVVIDRSSIWRFRLGDKGKRWPGASAFNTLPVFPFSRIVADERFELGAIGPLQQNNFVELEIASRRGEFSALRDLIRERFQSLSEFQERGIGLTGDGARERRFRLKIFLASAKLFLGERRCRERENFNAPLLPPLQPLEI